MNRVIAGSWERQGLLSIASGDDRNRLAEHPLCLLDGGISNLASVAREAGVSAHLAPERILRDAYTRWGSRLVERLRGEFALLIWNPKTKRGILARDQLGQRPLHFYSRSGELLFASEIRDLLPLLPQRPGPDDLAVAYWLSDGMIPENRTLYEGVHRLGAGHLIELADRGWSVRRYWSLPESPGLRPSRHEAAARLREEITRSVRDRIAADSDAGKGRIGVLLSGGLDSSTVAAIACEVAGPERVKAYSATFPEHPEVDESSLIHGLTQDLGIDGAEVRVTSPRPLAAALDYLLDWKVPAPVPNYYFWQSLLNQAADDGTSTIISGDGGDELFGAAKYLPADRLRQGRVFAALAAARDRPYYATPPPPIEVLKRLRYTGLWPAAPHSLHRAIRQLRGPQLSSHRWLREEYRQLVAEAMTNWSWKRGGGDRWRAYMFHLITDLAERFGVRDHFRRSAGSAGLAHRHPFYDVELIEFVLGLPPELSLDPWLNRPLLREAIRGLVPDQIRLRPDKTRFDTLVTDGQVGQLDTARRLLEADDSEVRAYTDAAALAELLSGVPSDRDPAAPGTWASSVWGLVTMECWLRTERDPSFPQHAAEALAARSPIAA